MTPFNIHAQLSIGAIALFTVFGLNFNCSTGTLYFACASSVSSGEPRYSIFV